MQSSTSRIWFVLALFSLSVLVSCDSGGGTPEPDESSEVNVEVTGTVTSAENDEPIGGATVEVLRADNGNTLASATTDTTGSYEATFTIEEPNAPDQIRLALSAEGFVDKEVSTGFQPSVTEDVTLEAMSVEATASGTVTDSDTGDPIEGASVTGTRPDGGEQLFQATTSSDGTYEASFEVADEPSEIEISANADGFEMASQTVTFSGDISASFELPSATTQSTASGQVTREDNGDPIGGASVTGTRASSGEKLFETTTASDGTYEATFGLTDEPSEVTIQADAENFESGEQTVNFGKQITADVSLRPVTIEATASGTVSRSDSGDPIEGATVTGTRASSGEQLFEVTTSSDGSYQASYSVKATNEPSDVALSANATNFKSADKTVSFSEEITGDLRLEAEITESVASGTVTRSDTGDPIEGATITGTRPDTGEQLFKTTTSSDGSYQVSFEVKATDEPSDVTLSADAEDFDSKTSTVDFSQQITTDFALEVATTEATASGTVSRSDTGDPIEGATITSTRPDTGKQLFETTTSSDGSYQASFEVKATNEPSEVTLSASATDFKSGESIVAFAPSITLDFLLEATVTGVQTTPVIANSGNFGAQDGSLTLYNPTDSTATLKDIEVAFINSLAVHNGRLFVVVDNTASDNAGRVTTFDTDRLEPIDQISNPRPPRYIAFPGNDKGYITNRGIGETQPSTVSVVDLVDNSVTKQVDVGRSPQGMGVAGGKAFVANAADGTLSVLDADADTVNTTLSLPDCASPKSVFVDDENEVAVVCQGGGEQGSEVLFLSPVEETIKDRVELGAPIGSANSSQSAYYSEGAEELYAVSGSEAFGGGTGEIFRIDTSANVLDRTFQVPQDDGLIGISAVGYDDVTQDLYVTRLPVGADGNPLYTENGTALVLNRQGNEVTRFETGNAPGHITFLDDRQ